MKKFITILIIFITINLLSNDPGVYSIKIKNFKKKIYSENLSRFKLISSGKEFKLINSKFQKVIKSLIIDGERAITIETGKIKNQDYDSRSPDKSLLKNTRFLNIDKIEIKKMAGKAADKSNNTNDLIANIEESVYNHISNKIMGIPFLSAIEVYRNKIGDCTEHAVLTIALFRSLGIPARGVLGIFLGEHFQEEENVFIFHMWAEVFLGNRWQLVDATRPGEKHLNRYIAFTYHNLKTETPLSYLKAIYSIRDMRVEYITISPTSP
jgi:transglutaminase superfamily protein